MKKIAVAGLLAGSMLCAQPALASHVFSSDAEINGIDLFTAAGATTNPLFTVTQGGFLTWTQEIDGAAGTATIDLSGFAGVSPDPFTFTYPGGGFSAPQSYSQNITFNTLGSFSGSARIVTTGAPNYRFANGTSVSNPTALFRVNVVAASSPVPEPATWAFMIVGFGAVGASMRASRRKAAATALA